MKVKQRKVRVLNSTLWLLFTDPDPFIWQPRWVAVNEDGWPVAVDGQLNRNWTQEFISGLQEAAEASKSATDYEEVPTWALWATICDLARRVR